jgi:hypothetical protein
MLGVSIRKIYLKGLPASEVLPPHKIALMIQSITEYMYTQFKLPERLAAVKAGTYEEYGALFAPEGEEYIPKPIVLENKLWSEDEEFLRQIFSGLNPLQKKKITNYLKATLAKRATVGPKRYRHDDAGCPERGRPFFFLCWIKTTCLRESKPSPAVERKES